MAKPNEKTPLTSKPTGRSPFFYFFMLLGFLAVAAAFGAAVFFSGGVALPLLGGILFANFTPIIASVLGGLTLAVAASAVFGVLRGAYYGLKGLFSRLFTKNVVKETLNDPHKMAASINSIDEPKTAFTSKQLPEMYQKIDFPENPQKPLDRTGLPEWTIDRNKGAVMNGAIRDFNYFTKEQVEALFSPSLIIQVGAAISECASAITQDYVKKGIDLAYVPENSSEAVNEEKRKNDVKTALTQAKPDIIAHVEKELPNTFQSKLALALAGRTPTDIGTSDLKRNKNLMKEIGLTDMPSDDEVNHIAACVFKIQSDMYLALGELHPAPQDDKKNTAFMLKWKGIETQLNRAAKPIVEKYLENSTHKILDRVDPEHTTHPTADTAAKPQEPGTPRPQSDNSPKEPPSTFPPPDLNH